VRTWTQLQKRKLSRLCFDAHPFQDDEWQYLGLGFNLKVARCDAPLIPAKSFELVVTDEGVSYSSPSVNHTHFDTSRNDPEAVRNSLRVSAALHSEMQETGVL
jgi:hypothetical protein